MEEVKELKIKVYDLSVELQNYENNVQQYTNQNILPLRREIQETNNKINQLLSRQNEEEKTGSGDTSI